MILNEDKILILDGAMGTMIQRYGLKEEDYRGTDFADCTKELRGNNECLNLTHPEVIKEIHNEYIAAGADIIETNTFSANRISQKEYDCGHIAPKMAYEGARIAREAADEAAAIAAKVGLSRKVWVAGSMGPTSKSLSLSPDIADPAFRPYSFDQMVEAYREQAEALLKGGADLLLIETCFDALNVKAALTAVHDICRNFVLPKTPAFASLRHPLAGGGMSSSASNIPTKNNNEVPVMISVSVGDRSGRTLTGQTLEAFHTAVSHYPITAFGLNCSLGASELLPLIEEVNRWCGCGVSCYPNAGLPNEMGGYDQTPEEMAGQIRVMAEKGLLNIVGGCCGTTPDHIRAIAKAVRDISPRTISGKTCDFPDKILKVSGLEATEINVKKNNFTNVGERTNVAGSRKFARLISEGKYDEALQIAAKQIEDGASIIDINMDDAMLDSTREMERFVRYISNDPAVAKAALMIDSSHWETILAGLKNAQGKCIVNSISLKEGEEEFIRKARIIKSLGAAIVVMAFDEEGQATTYNRKIHICARAYRLLTEKAGVSPENIIFDVNILSIGTGIEEHAKYAVDYIEAVRWIKSNLPGALTSGGVSNLSFAFRGNNAVREAMHSAFLYHAIKAGLDMAILNPSMLQVYDEIELELLKCVEDVIFDKDALATERLIDKASRMLEAANSPATPETASDISGTTSVIPSASSVILSGAKNLPPVGERLQTDLVRGRTDSLEKDLNDAMEQYGSALAVIEGPLMAGMETVGSLFGEGKMFLPQVVKSAKVMRDAARYLEPYMNNDDDHSESRQKKPVVVIATVKGDVHDIGKNITG
ncbi:MAG: homocysteine S-methyltransferase family protein, partial [Bacteroidales bacterium]|nr:homocysteine S-methyltransferase family protein [Bacteroidales bacterium]